MNPIEWIRRWRGWFPIPAHGWRPEFVRWALLEGNRLGLVGALLTFVFATLMITGRIWTFEMQMILTETSTVENLLETFLGGIILLVSIVVSINSIVLSKDITSIESQEERVRGTLDFNQRIGDLSEGDEIPTDPETFMTVMADVISRRAEDVIETMDTTDQELIEETEGFVQSVQDTMDQFEDIDNAHGSEYAILWRSLDLDYGVVLNRSRALRNTNDEDLSAAHSDALDRLTESLQLFAIGREYFKTLYYTKEVSRLSRILLIVSLPAILTTSTAILAINAQILPEVWVLGLPPLQSFVATMFTIALVPYVVLTSYMLRLSTVAMRTATGGPFSLK